MQQPFRSLTNSNKKESLLRFVFNSFNRFDIRIAFEISASRSLFCISSRASLTQQGFAAGLKIFTKKLHLPLAISLNRYN